MSWKVLELSLHLKSPGIEFTPEKSWNWVYTRKVLELSLRLESPGIEFTPGKSWVFWDILRNAFRTDQLDFIFNYVSCIVERNTGVMLIITIWWNSLTTTVRTPLWIVLIGRSLDLMIEMDSNQHYGLAVKVFLQYIFFLYDFSLSETGFVILDIVVVKRRA